jgi:hypothetical protein
MGMTKTELRDKLIATIAETEDMRLLEDIFRIVNIETEPQGIYELSEPESSAVREGVEQLNNGQFISNEDLNTRINKWLGE